MLMGMWKKVEDFGQLIMDDAVQNNFISFWLTSYFVCSFAFCSCSLSAWMFSVQHFFVNNFCYHWKGKKDKNQVISTVWKILNDIACHVMDRMLISVWASWISESSHLTLACHSKSCNAFFCSNQIYDALFGLLWSLITRPLKNGCYNYLERVSIVAKIPLDTCITIRFSNRV